MLIKILFNCIIGYIRIFVEGYYIERFINICQNKKILIWSLKREKGVKLYLNIGIRDFKKLKETVHGKLDHQYINEIVDFNPTAEKMAEWICKEVTKVCEVGKCYKVEVQESEGNVAIYEEV